MKFWEPWIKRRVKIVRVANPDNQMYVGTFATIAALSGPYVVLKMDQPMGKMSIQTWNCSGLEPEEFTPEEAERNVREEYADQYL